MQSKKAPLIWWTMLAVLIILVILFFDYKNRAVAPTIGADGKISGNYSIASIMKLGKPYKCAFEKNDGTSQIAGTVLTDGSKISGKFAIKTDLAKNGFNDFLIIKNGKAYIWTSLQNLGYEHPAAKSAGADASPQDQAQIVGTEDLIQYDCAPWTIDNSVFETPSSIQFSEVK